MISADNDPARSQANGVGNADTRERIASAGREAVDEAKRRADDLYRNTTRGAGRVANQASDAVDGAADALADRGQERLSQAAHALSERMRGLSGYLENRGLDDLITDATRLAQRNPALFIAGGVAIGFALSRFLKASSSQAQQRRF
jgi:hypothetical protein